MQPTPSPNLPTPSPNLPSPVIPVNFICLPSCQQSLAYVSAAFLGIIITTILYLSCRRLRLEKQQEVIRSSRRRSNQSRSTSQSFTSSLNDSFDTDSITSSVLYGSI